MKGRGKGYGKELMLKALKILKEEDPSIPIKIGAQVYLKEFYESLGFSACGEIYVEDGIQHLHMLYHQNI